MNIIKTTTEENSYFALIPNCSACTCYTSPGNQYAINTTNYRFNGEVTPYSNNTNK